MGRATRLVTEPRSSSDVIGEHSQFRLDLERIRFSPYFSRLSAVTQVIAQPGAGPLIHNRLTHSIKVTAVARAIAVSLTDASSPHRAFALVTVVPSDVDDAHVATLKREFVDRVDLISAPRFSEFWEMDPCEPGKAEQEWQRDMTAKGPGMLGDVSIGPTKKLAKELTLDVEAQKKEGEYKLTVLDSIDALKAHTPAEVFTSVHDILKQIR